MVREAKKAPQPLMKPVSRGRIVGIGQALPFKRDVTRQVRWPTYVWRQRRTRILWHRLHRPPAVHQFATTVDAAKKQELFKLLAKYKPEGKAERQARLHHNEKAKEQYLIKARKDAKKGKGPVKTSKDFRPKKAPIQLRCGLKCVTRLIEQKKAKLVAIAHDVTPLELVVWMPALCRKLNVPYCIVKGKAALGQLVGFKTATCVAIDAIRPEDKPALDKLAEACKIDFLDKYEDTRKVWGGLEMAKRGRKTKGVKPAAPAS